eukprot:3203650-Pyramimonas_sp.AAC.1
MGGKEAEEMLKKTKARTRFIARHEKGHWKGVSERGKTRPSGGGSSSSLQRGGRGGGRGFLARPGGFQRRAGCAMTAA